jgi:hypothetical protein
MEHELQIYIKRQGNTRQPRSSGHKRHPRITRTASTPTDEQDIVVLDDITNDTADTRRFTNSEGHFFKSGLGLSPSWMQTVEWANGCGFLRQ